MFFFVTFMVLVSSNNFFAYSLEQEDKGTSKSSTALDRKITSPSSDRSGCKRLLGLLASVEGDMLGTSLGPIEGNVLGNFEDFLLGMILGCNDGNKLGIVLGIDDGDPLGSSDGIMLGTYEGILLGIILGNIEGSFDG